VNTHIHDENVAYNFTFLAPADVSTDFLLAQNFFGLTSMDGNMSDTYFSFGNKNFSRQELVDFLVKVYTCLHDNADYLTHIKSFDFVD